MTEYRLPRARYVSGTQVDATTEERLRVLVEQGRHDDEIAETLNHDATTRGLGRQWDAQAVARVRRRLRVSRPGAFPANKALPDRRPDGLYSTRGVAARFGVRPRTVSRWVQIGKLQIADGGGPRDPAWFDLDQQTIDRLEAHMAEVSKLRGGGAS